VLTVVCPICGEVWAGLAFEDPAYLILDERIRQEYREHRRAGKSHYISRRLVFAEYGCAAFGKEHGPWRNATREDEEAAKETAMRAVEDLDDPQD